MKLYKRLSALLLIILTALTFSTVAFAAEPIDLDEDIKLTISYQDNKTAIYNAKFDLYLVADMNEQGELTTTSPFRRYDIDISSKTDNETLKNIAYTLEGYVLRDKISPVDTQVTDSKGIVAFPSESKSLKPGLYLVLSNKQRQGKYYYEASPFMVLLPFYDDSNTISYNVTCMAKYVTSPVNNATVNKSVIKIWDDDKNENNRPQKITVQLLKDGTVYDTVTLNKKNNWRYTWSNLPEKYKWNIVEKELKDYKVSISQNGKTFIITNTFTGDASDNPSLPEKLPQTGQLWWPVPILLFMGLVLIIFGLIRRNRGIYNEK